MIAAFVIKRDRSEAAYCFRDELSPFFPALVLRQPSELSTRFFRDLQIVRSKYSKTLDVGLNLRLTFQILSFCPDFDDMLNEDNGSH